MVPPATGGIAVKALLKFSEALDRLDDRQSADSADLKGKMMASTKVIKPWVSIRTCFAVALFEGLDIQSMGVAAPKVGPLFHISAQSMGFVLSASTAGLTLGAAVGGWLSDWFGRRAILITSLALLGLFSWGTSLASGFQTLLIMRFLAGIGLGGVFPCLIAVTSDVAKPQVRARALALVYCAMPAGGGFAAWLMSVTPPTDWYTVFRLGGLGPLALMPLVYFGIPSQVRAVLDKRAKPQNGEHGHLLQHFGARSARTGLLWTAFFFTLFAGYMLLNWLPSMLVGRGFSKAEASHAAIMLNAGAIAGSLVFGRAADSGRTVATLGSAYAGMLLALIVLIQVSGWGVLWAAFATGFFVIGGQLVLYALAPLVYPTESRGTGVGAAVAAGRVGSVLGPILAGVAISYGLPSGSAPIIAVPGLVIAMSASLYLVARHVSADHIPTTASSRSAARDSVERG